MSSKIVCLLLAMGLLTPIASADVVGVTEAALLANAVKQLEQLQEQYQTLKRTHDIAQAQLNNAKSQLDSINQLKESSTGHNGFGDLYNSLDDLKRRQWAPDTWDDALRNVSGGNPERYQQLLDAYEKKHKPLDDALFEKGASKHQLELHKQNRAVNKAVSVESTYTYNEINKHIKTIHNLSSQIEKAENTKSALDLNSRLVAEVAYTQAQNLKLQTLISQQLAQNGSNDLDIERRIAEFNRLPDE